MKKTIFFLFLIVISISKSYAQCQLDYSNYHLVLDEEFNEPASHGDPATSTDLSVLPSYWLTTGLDGCWQGQAEHYFSSQVSFVRDPANPSNYFLRLTATQVVSTSTYTNTCGGTWTCTDCDIAASPCDPTTLGCTEAYKYKSGMVYIDHAAANAAVYTGLGCSDCKFDGIGSGWAGFQKGMFEIRMKIPAGDTWPAFWIDGPFTFNPFEGKENPYDFGTGFSSWWDATGQGFWHETVSTNLSADFHIYTCVWTSDQVAFFLDGIEVASYSGSVVASMWPSSTTNMASRVIAALEMHPWSSVTTCNLDLDYIKVYKPNPPTTSVPDPEDAYRSSPYVFMNWNTFILQNPLALSTTSTYTTASNKYQSIATTSKPGEVYYAGNDGRLYQEEPTSPNTWSNGQLSCAACVGAYGAGAAHATLIQGDIVYDQSNKIIYKGNDNRLQYYGYYVPTSGPAYWYQAYIDDYWSTTNYEVSSHEGSIADANGIVFYVDRDEADALDRIRVCEYRSGTFTFSLIPYGYPWVISGYVGGARPHYILSHPDNVSNSGGDIRLFTKVRMIT
jgi:hypothetical protein